MTAPHPLAGKVAVVTGGGRGIGRMVAEGLVHAGAKVYLCSRKAADLGDTAAALAQHGQAEAVVADLGSAEGVTTLAEHVAGREDRLHLLFNNAGATWGAPLHDFPEAGWDKVMDVNAKGPFLLTQALLPLLRAASTADDPARIVNIGSIDGLRTPGRGFNNFSYSASKAAVHMLTRHLAAELAPDVLVNAIAPGLFESKMTAGLLSFGEDALAEQIPLKRIGRPHDIASLAVFLSGNGSSYITGAIIPVDGGASAAG